ncbi:MAG TPA: O-antigen ligase family protein [Anaerohalosphaeraceae bacterium]|jgi:hypothetical protein|nr:O-antigen ligase family protein [Anaerohalosphaeraceae bacterium]HRT51683.1 O-antigen ligase family protein [Anaerohalosphaeraceae bacterium]HRT87358.1 O-antigen ligase family protein [Anaerohalosphaeraceae bacterium]
MRRGKTTGRVVRQGGRGFERFEGVLLIVCLCVLAVRATYIESPHGGILNPRQYLTNEAFSVFLSGALILAAAAWFVAAFCRRTVTYRFSGIEYGLGLFVVAGLAAAATASNKRAAINDLATLAAPMLAAVMLVQVLGRGERLRLVLFVVFALAAVTTWQCVDQFLASNEDMIADYEQNPQRHLEVIGAEPGSFEQMLYEHRLYGKDIRGFLTTSNSTASLLLLAAFTATGFAVDCVRGRRDRSSHAMIACVVLAAVIAWAGLVVVHSRGALGAAAVGLVMFAAAAIFGRRLWRFRKALLVLFVLGSLAAAVAVIGYGARNDSLPGGASMLVRWQYWKGAAAMRADYPAVGVGGGNFAGHYPHYKEAAAPETVSDPHNFVLSLLSQYGPAGLIGFAAAFVAVLYRSAFSERRRGGVREEDQEEPSRRFAIAVLCATGAAMLVLRPVLNAAELGDRVGVMVYVAAALYVLPAAAFGVVFVLLWLSSRGAPLQIRDAKLADSGEDASAGNDGGGLATGIFCGAAAVVIHNLIDFAIFEPGVLTLFWVLIACLFAADSQRKGRVAAVFAPGDAVRVAVVGGAAVVVIAFLAGVLAPTAAAGRLTQRALNDAYAATELLEEAAAADVLGPAGPSMAGKAYLQRYLEGGRADEALLERAAECFKEASRRDRAHFKHYEKLAQVYELMAARASGEQRDCLEEAFAALSEAVRRYPGSDRLHLKAARVADEMGRKDEAVFHYERAVAIEEAYRVQFAVMYPGRELFSRLGEKNYQFAKVRLSALKQ